MPLQIRSRADDVDKHSADVTALLFTKGKLYSGGDDGKIKAWEEDLKLSGQVDAHPASVFSLAASNNTLYSCSNDGTLKYFELATLADKGVLLKTQDEFWKVSYVNGKLYVGDNQGQLRVYKEKRLLAEENTCDPIKDMVVTGDFVFTVKDLDVVITQFVKGEDKLIPTTKKTLLGRAPLISIGGNIVFTSRSGKDILVHQNTGPFDEVAQAKDAHEMIINALAGTNIGGKSVIFSAGWDQQVKQWAIEGKELKPLGSVNVGFVVNALAIGEKGEIYAGGGDGHIVRVDL